LAKGDLGRVKELRATFADTLRGRHEESWAGCSPEHTEEHWKEYSEGKRADMLRLTFEIQTEADVIPLKASAE
jgi:hypothetical protein